MRAFAECAGLLRHKTYFSRQQFLRASSESFRRSARVPGVTVVADVASAQKALAVLRSNVDRPHAWDTETADLSISRSKRSQSPVNHGRIVCATCFCGDDVDFGQGPRLFIDNSGPASGLIHDVFKEYFEDTSAKKVFHNYSFERHMLKRHGINLQGFYADTMHMARLYDTSLSNWESEVKRKMQRSQAVAPSRPAGPVKLKKVLGVRLAGRPLSSSKLHTLSSTTLSSAPPFPMMMELPSGVRADDDDIAESWNTAPAQAGYTLKGLSSLYGISEQPGKHFWQLWGSDADASQRALDSPEMFPRFAEYSTDDSRLTYLLFNFLKQKLQHRPWYTAVHERSIRDVLRDKGVVQKLLMRERRSRVAEQHDTGKNMWHLYEDYVQDLAVVLAELEETGIRVDMEHLKRMEESALGHIESARNMFVDGVGVMRDDAGAPLNPHLSLMNPQSSVQVRTLLFGGATSTHRDEPRELERSKEFPAPKGATGPDGSRLRRIEVSSIGLIPSTKIAERSMATGLPKISASVLKRYAGDPDKGREGEALSQLRKRGVPEDEAARFVSGLNGLCAHGSTNRIISNCLRPLQEHTAVSTGRIHASWQFDTATGRLVCRSPNLQNLPMLAQGKYSVKAAFVPAPGNAFVIADYGQLELCVLAHVAGCKRMSEALSKGGDYHSEVAVEMFPHIQAAVRNGEAVVNGKDPARFGPNGEILCPTVKEAYPKERNKAKTINFGIIFGKTPVSIAEDLGIEKSEAEQLMRSWFDSKPAVQGWIKRCKQEGYDQKRVLSLLGRWRTMPLLDWGVEYRHRSKSERAAVNFCIQGSAADIVMAAMLQLWRDEELKSLGFKLVLQVHDEFVLEGPKEHAERAKEKLVELMKSPFAKFNPDFKLRVPLSVDAAVSDSLAGKP